MKTIRTAIMAVCCIILLSGGASAGSYGMEKLKKVITSDYYNQRPDLQDAIVYELIFDFDGLTDDFETRAQQYAAYWGELKNATPVNHRYYKLFAADYKYWSDEAERQIYKFDLQGFERDLRRDKKDR